MSRSTELDGDVGFSGGGSIGAFAACARVIACTSCPSSGADLLSCSCGVLFSVVIGPGSDVLWASIFVWSLRCDPF